MEFKDASLEQVNDSMNQAREAFRSYRKLPVARRLQWMNTIAEKLQEAADELIEIAGRETHLPPARLRSELARTCFQLTSYAAASGRGDHLQVRIDAANPGLQPPQPDLRKMMLPIGPVVVFGAANFPFAYSTAGGDTASALAAGCTVVVKAHPAHAATSQRVAQCIEEAMLLTAIPLHSFQHLHGKSNDVGKALVEHAHTAAVGFTGSLAGGRQLFDWACQRARPIPVFAEMSSINPVFLLPDQLQADPEGLAKTIAGSVTLGVGQFCTNPGLLIAPQMPALERFKEALAREIEQTQPDEMLHTGIFQNYVEKRANALAQSDVEMLATASSEPLYNQGLATLATVTASAFKANPILHQEVFGPYSLLVTCTDMAEVQELAGTLEGQLTATLMATERDLDEYPELPEMLTDLAGRVILNGVPTGVAVCQSQMHGGPYPATTDSRFTAVGADAILRFVRPVAFQNWPAHRLPAELRGDA